MTTLYTSGYNYNVITTLYTTIWNSVISMLMSALELFWTWGEDGICASCNCSGSTFLTSGFSVAPRRCSVRKFQMLKF